MSEKLTTFDVREMFVDRWWENHATPTEYGPQFDEWLESVKALYECGLPGAVIELEKGN